MSDDVSKGRVLEELRRIKGPDLSDNIVNLGLVSDVFIKDGRVMFAISVDPARAKELEPLRQAAQQVVEALPGVTRALVTLTAERGLGQASASAPSPVHPTIVARSGAAAPPRPEPRSESAPLPPRARAGTAQPQPPQGVPGVARIVAVASGKGGVGKSTTAVNLALAFAAEGRRVGVLDADIYGPSMPRLLGVTGRPQPIGNNLLRPLEAYGVKVMSMGFLVEEDTPMIWRGPMVMSAITQMLKEVAWGELDLLVVDMPPGTGDAQLTMAQQVPLAGAIIVSTPQDLALIDARKGLNMFRKVDVPVLGIVENMSFFVCPSCGTQSDIFGHGGAREEAEKLGVPFLGGVPLHMDIRATSDAGRPVVASDPESAHARAYRDIAAAAYVELERIASGTSKPAPRIVMEG
jgi:ATP-binding protein involved in chromosome partitioning